MLWLFFALKIPLLTLCWLVWWAIHQEPETDEHTRDDGGAKIRPHPVPKLPRHPRRRGPHGGEALPSPARVRRHVHAKARSVGSR